MAVFKLILMTTFAIFCSIDSFCGPPGSPLGADVYGHISIAIEGESISYQCKHAFKQVYGNSRKCVRGKWTPRIPKCAIKENTRLKVENYKVNYFDIKESVGHNVKEHFEYLQYITLNLSRRFTLQVNYLPNSRLSYVELDLQILSNSLPSNLTVSLLTNDYRDCVESSQNLLKVNSVIEFKFICESKSDVDYEIEGKDLPNSLRFSFESENKFMSRIIRISVFRFQDECGSPDIPLNAKTITNSGNSVSIYPSKSERYKIWGKDFDTVSCLYEGNWDKEFQPLYPIIQCPFEDFDWNSLHYKNISLEYFEYFNDTLLAAVDSKIQFQCNNSHNSSEYHYLYCREDGEWTGEFDICEEKESNNTNQLPDESDLFVIIVTLISTFVTTLTLVLIFGSIIVWRRKQLKKRKLKNLSVKYVKQYENYRQVFGEEMSSTGHYEAIDYQEIDLVTDNKDRADINHYYTQILD